MRWLIWVAAVTCAVGASAAHTDTVYRCVGGSGEVMFTDLPCPGGRVQAPHAVVTIDMGSLSAAEVATLNRLHRDDAARGKQSKQPRSDSIVHSLTQAARRCAAARAGLDQVHAIKRHGYRAASAAALDARERKYRSQQKQSCVAIPLY
jgi:hypothetical protein